MSNIERKYSYHDDGVLPSEGEYGVTYLTLYSSGAGNVYDGWLWDPDRRNYSETERTFGYRNPDYPDYCWDDEVVVDLSNAQARQETSDFAQGRITSFNTNVSNVPIVLQDIDITGLDEEEREAKATVVLFSKIPLVKDAYIQAMVEVQMKVNISPDNTNGMVRVEAFYILNDESDRTMRPNPVHTFAVSTANERHTLPWLYWNPALKHEDNNYIGVKLLCTGGTAEIGISDNPEYGDAMITLTSAGLTGDHIDSGYPVALEIFGKEQVPGGYKLKEEDYTVLCTYDTGEVYEVTRLCTFNPAMGEKVIDPVTTLTATYQGLQASMTLYLALVESIELIGLTDFYEDTYTFNLDDFVVLAHYDTGDVMDISEDEELVYDPPMGTTINDDTVLTATYAPEYMPSSEFEDSIEVVKHSMIARGTSSMGGLVYTLYDDNLIEITGDATHTDSSSTNRRINEYIKLPDQIVSSITTNSIVSYRLKWNADGEISGFYLPAVQWSSSASSWRGMISQFLGFDDISIVPYFDQLPVAHNMSTNPVIMYFQGQSLLSRHTIDFLGNITYSNVRNLPVIITNVINSIGSNQTGELSYCFQHATWLRDLSFLTEWDVSRVVNMMSMFDECVGISDVNALSDWDVSMVTNINSMFRDCTALEDISGLKDWNVSSLYSTVEMFERCRKLENASDLAGWNMPSVTSIGMMFFDSGLNTLEGIGTALLTAGQSAQGLNCVLTFSQTKITDLYGLPDDSFTNGYLVPSQLFGACNYLETLDGSSNLDLSESTSMEFMFQGCRKLADISACRDWDTSSVTNFRGVFSDCGSIENINNTAGWDLSLADNVHLMFYVSGENNYSNRYTSEQMSKYSCSPTLFAQYSNVLTDSIVFQIERLTVSGETNDYLKLYRAYLDDSTSSTEYYVAYTGMFQGRDLFKLIQTSLSPSAYRAEFVNPNAIPSWYRDRINYYISERLFVR